MSETEKAHDAPEDHSSHTFPNLHEAASGHTSDDTASGALFQPMFNEGASEVASSIAGSHMSNPNTPDEPLEHARRIGYQRGFAAGREKACQMVQNDLSPIIFELTETLKQFGEYQQGMCESGADISLKLALEIVEKITGAASTLKLEDLADVGTLIRNTLASSYGLSLQLNPHDFNLMKELSACEGSLVLENFQGIAVSTDNDIRSGEVNSTENALHLDPAHKQVALSLDKILASKSNLPE